MADIIGLLFGVDGGGKLNGASGKIIAGQLTELVNEINSERNRPKIKFGFDTGDAVKALKAELDEVFGSADGFNHITKVFGSINTLMAKIAKNTGGLKSAMKSIVDALPKDGSSGIDDILNQLNEMRRLVDEISKKDVNITNVFNKGGVKNSAEELRLYREEAKELLALVSKMSSSVADFAGKEGLSFGSMLGVEKMQKYVNTMASFNEFDIDSNIVSADTVSKLKKITGTLNSYKTVLQDVIDAGASRGAVMPDTSGYESAVKNLENYAKRVEEIDKRFDEAVERTTGGKTGSAPASNQTGMTVDESSTNGIKEMVGEVTDLFVSLRKKIEETFDFSSLTIDTTKIKDALKEVSEQLSGLNALASALATATQNANGGDGSGGKQGGSSKKRGPSRYAELTKQIKEYSKEVTKLTKDASRSGGASHDLEMNWSVATDKEHSDAADKLKNHVELVNRLKQAYTDLGIKMSEMKKVTGKDGKEKEVTEIKPFFDRANEILSNQSRMAENAKSAGVSLDEYKRLLEQVVAAERDYLKFSRDNDQNSNNTWDKQRKKAMQYVESLRDIGATARNTAVNKLAKELDEIVKDGNITDLERLRKKMDELGDAVAKNGVQTETWGNKFVKTFGSHVRSALASLITLDVGQAIRGIYTNVVNLDKAVTDLQIATGMARDEVKSLVREYSVLAKELGATTAEVAASADTWLRQGYNVEQTNELIKASMMLSKLGQIDSAEAAKYLTSAMKGYGKSVEDVVSIVDKLTAVDMESATSAGGIATAMAETAASAELAGMSMDRLIGYLSTISEVTQDSEESVGTFMKTLLARMNNVKVGKFVDDETGEDLNDVEKVLGELGIKLRDDNELFRDAADVLDEVGNRWDEFNNVQQRAIATAMAGTRQQEKFIVMMQNYGTAMDYAGIAAESSGTSLEKYEAHLESIDGKMASLTASFESISSSLLDSSAVSGALNILISIAGAIEEISIATDGMAVMIPTIVIGLATILSLLVQIAKTEAGVTFFKTMKGMIMFFPTVIKYLISLAVSHKTATAGLHEHVRAVQKVDAAYKSLKSIGIVGAIGAITAAVTIAISIYNAWKNSIEEQKQAIKEAGEEAATLSDEISELASSYAELSEQINMDNSAKEALLDTQDKLIEKLGLERYELDQLIEKYGSYRTALLNASGAKLKDARLDIESSIDVLEDELYGEVHKSFGTGRVNFSGGFDSSDSEQRDRTHNALKELYELGYIDDYKNAVFMAHGGRNLNVDFALSDRYDLESSDGIISATEDISKMLDVAKKHVGDDSGLYEAIYNRYKDISGAISNYRDEISKFNSNLIQEHASLKLVDIETPDEKLEFDNYRQSVIDAVIASGEFAGSQEEIASAVDEILSKQTQFSGFYQSTGGFLEGVVVKAKKLSDILEELQGPIDGIFKAMEQVDEAGYLTADGLSTILGLEEEFKAIGMDVFNVLEQDEKGYRLAADAIEQYANAVLLANTVTGEFATEQDMKNYLENLKNTRSILAMIIQSYKDANAASEKEALTDRRKEELESEKDAFNDQLDAYKELIDIRKDLLETYAEELEYQKELEKKQKNVARLQSKLAVARLDTSAAGQARVRELEAELKDAEEELEDFTLEHAIDVLTAELDEQYGEYEKFIKGKLDKIEKLLADLDTSPEVNVNTDVSGLESLLAQINAKIKEVESPPDDNPIGTPGDSSELITEKQKTLGRVGVETVSEDIFNTDAGLQATYGSYENYINSLYDSEKEKARRAAQEYVDSNNMSEINKESWTINEQFKKLLAAYQEFGGSIHDINGSLDRGKTLTEEQFERNQVLSRQMSYKEYLNKVRWRTQQDAYDDDVGVISEYDFYNNLHWDKKYGTYENYLGELFDKTYGIYHTGGFVGGFTSLKSNEEFAKLLKEEFVATPTMMKRFMEHTLPSIASWNSGGTNEFNAPLVSISCDSVTTESLPGLKQVVDDAVKEIQKQLDSGMSRTGYKRSTKKLLI